MAREIVRIGFNQFDLHRIELKVYDFNLWGLVAQRAFDGKIHPVGLILGIHKAMGISVTN